MNAFDYRRPRTIDEALALLNADDEAQLLAGGMTLIPTMKQRLAAPSVLIDLALIDDLRGIRWEAQQLVVGAMATHWEVAESDLAKQHVPSLASLAYGIGHAQVRHRGTLGGSIANNDPAADYPAALLALGGVVETNRRSIEADHFFTGMFETALAADEIVTAVRFPTAEMAAYAKFPNPASKYAMVGVFVARQESTVRVAVTGAASCVFRHRELEQALQRRFDADAVDAVMIDATDFNQDIHASADYRAELVKVMAGRAVKACVAR